MKTYLVVVNICDSKYLKHHKVQQDNSSVWLGRDICIYTIQTLFLQHAERRCMNAVGWLWITVPCCLMKTALDKLWHIYTHHGAALLQNTGGFCQLSRHCERNNVRILCVLWSYGWEGKQRNACLSFVCMCARICSYVCTFIYLYLQACARAWIHLHLSVCNSGLWRECVFMHGCIVCMCMCRGVCVCVYVWGLLLAIQADRCQVVSEHRSSDQVKTWRRKGESPGYAGATKLLGLV